MKLYSLSDIEQGRLPKKSDFQWAANELGRLLLNRRQFVGAILSGSTSRGMAGRSSDLDGVIVFRHQAYTEAWREFEIFAHRLQQRYIPYQDLVMIDQDSWMSNSHCISAGYLKHLQHCAINFPLSCYGDYILETIGEPGLSAIDSSRSYTSQKLRKLGYLRTWAGKAWAGPWLDLAEQVAMAPQYSLLRLMECKGQAMTSGRYDSQGVSDAIRTYLSIYEGGVEADAAARLIQNIAEIRPEIEEGLEMALHDRDAGLYKRSVGRLVNLAESAYHTVDWVNGRLS